jgi:hypothetical protein
VVIAAAQREVLLDPDDLSSKLQPAGGEARSNDVAHAELRRAGAVGAANSVVPQQPDVAAPSDRSIRYFRNAVRIRQTARFETGQDGFEPNRLEADQAEVETGNPSSLSSLLSCSNFQLARAAN